MKHPLLLCLLVIGCAQPPVTKKRLCGTWQMTNVVNTAGIALSDRTIYFPNDSVSVSRFRGGKMMGTYSLKYELDTISNTLKWYDGEKPGKKFDIVRLTDDELDLKDRQTGSVVKNQRVFE